MHQTLQPRLPAMDLLRGFALLGIFFVNARFFAEPISSMHSRVSFGAGPLSAIAWWFTEVFCTGKFYVLFSTLFGAGLAIMHHNAAAAGRSFEWTAVRRLAFLAIVGACHAFLIWYGDILLIYSAIGLIMIWFARLHARTLLILSGVFALVGLVLTLGLGSLMISLAPTAPAEPWTPPPGESPLNQLLSGFQSGALQSMMDPAAASLEAAVFRDGPYADAVVLRLILYAGFLVVVVVSMVWQVLSCFCLGAALLKLGFFAGRLRSWHRLMFWIGLAFALPLNVLYAFAVPESEHSVRHLLMATVGLTLGGLATLSVFLSGAMLLLDSGRAHRLLSMIASAGRMAFTNYLTQSAIATFVMYHWGLAQFDQTTMAQRWLGVVAIWVVQVLVSHAWLSRFEYGPLEYVWRAATHLRLPRLLKAPAGP